MSVKILVGDAKEKLSSLADESVHCVVTSPPYWGLRDYGVDGQIGLEQIPQDYIDALVNVFQEVRRVLRKDGTVWLNLGDSYYRNPAKGGSGHGGKEHAYLGDIYGRGQRSRAWQKDNADASLGNARGLDCESANRGLSVLERTRNDTFKEKDLCMMPARVALALQADGWWLRSEIIWHKPNPMPESVTDRPTSSHEKIYLLAKSQRYYYDVEAVKEPYSDVSIARLSQPNFENQTGGPKDTLTGNRSHKKTLNNQHEKLMRQEKLGRNIRNVWTVATQPFPGAHFATFPPALIEPCIKAGTSEKGCCPKCGALWMRDVERTTELRDDLKGSAFDRGKTRDRDGGDRTQAGDRYKTQIVGWSPSCDCGLAEVPCTVLDPFGGAGTTGLVADRLKRSAILIELNPEYADMARKRIQMDAGMFAEVN
jgi:DNA modification methylase